MAVLASCRLCLFSSVPVSIIYWHIHCLAHIRHQVNTSILRSLPPNPEHCCTPAKPCTSGMENDCHLSPSFHLLTDGLWILTALLYNEQRLLAYRTAEHREGGHWGEGGADWGWGTFITSNNLLRWPWELAGCLARLGCNARICCYVIEMDGSAIVNFLLHSNLICSAFLNWICWNGVFSSCYLDCLTAHVCLLLCFQCLTNVHL